MRRTDTTREESNHLWYNKLTGKYHSLSGRQWISPGTEGAQKVLQKDGYVISQESSLGCGLESRMQSNKFPIYINQSKKINLKFFFKRQNI